MAAAFRTKRVPRVAIFYLDARKSILRGVARYVRQYGPWTIYRQPSDPDEMMPRWLARWEGDGIIGRVINQPTADLLRRTRLPFVDIRGTVRSPGIPLIHGDDRAVGEMAAEHLIERGFKRFGFYGWPNEIWSNDRRDAFAAKVAEVGGRCAVYEERPDLPRGPRGWDRSVERLAKWLMSLGRPAAVMGASDDFGERLLIAARRAGIRVPDELAVIGVDNDQAVCEVSDPPLSSVVQNQELLGYRAAELLDRLMRGEAAPQQPIYIRPSGVATRQSTDVLAIDDPFIAQAVNFIRRHACDGIGVRDVLREVPLSRSMLQRRFRRILGQSPIEAIIAMRLKRAQELLLETDMPLAEIARLTGFLHAEYLGANFRRRIGMTPSQFRRQAEGRGEAG